MLNIQLDNENPILHKHSNKSYLPTDNEDVPLGDSKYYIELEDSSSIGASYNDCGLPNKSGSNLLVSSNDYESFDEEEIFDIIRTIKDPEYSYSLEDLNVVSKDNIFFDENTFTVSVFFTPTVPHCSQATLIGLMIFVKLYQSLPPYFKIDVQISKGTHNNEDGINKQLLDKERIAAALENPTLVDMINDGIYNGTGENNLFHESW
ncbi:hypothetical protein MACJ_003952 [Theileria orientalis]|uniref:MIP18 family-like domain-containing protein n=1 Tax=Theileria orientalis TaxID=68886 RepID=A0A976XK22_THEOR|nr:hypothetical protein MACJ_003952 [Theileria orientalis]